MKRSLVCILVAALVACGPPIPRASDGGAERGGDGGSEAGADTTCKEPVPPPACANPASCALLDSNAGSNWCSDSAFSGPSASGTCFVPLTSGQVAYTVGTQEPASTSRVGARRVKGCLVDIFGGDVASAIRVVVPAAIGTFACSPETGAFVYFANLSGTSSIGYAGQGKCTVTVTAFGGQISGTFSVDGDLPISNGSFSVTLSP